MDLWTDIGLFLATVLWVAMLVKLTRRWFQNSVLTGLVVLAFIAAMVPFNGLVIGSYVFSVTSYLSISTLLLLVAFIVLSCAGARCEQLLGYWHCRRQWRPTVMFFAISGLLLYPLAGGLTMFDPYRLGFAGSPGSILLPLYLMGWAIVCLLRGWYLLLLLIASAVLCFYLKILPSLNLWDYVLDPLVVIYSLLMLLKALFCKVFKFQYLNKQVF